MYTIREINDWWFDKAKYESKKEVDRLKGVIEKIKKRVFWDKYEFFIGWRYNLAHVDIFYRCKICKKEDFYYDSDPKCKCYKKDKSTEAKINNYRVGKKEWTEAYVSMVKSKDIGVAKLLIQIATNEWVEKNIDKDIVKKKMENWKYSNFLKSMYWKIITTDIKRDKKACELCSSPNMLNVHHKTYSIHGFEHLNKEDLLCVCQSCHQKIHEND